MSFRLDRRRSACSPRRFVFAFVIFASLLAASPVRSSGDVAAAPAPTGSTPAPGGDAKPACHHAEMKADAPLDAASVYQLESHWTRADDKDFTLPELRGKVRVAAIFFASCQYACPILVGKMKKIEEQLPPEVRSQVGFLLVSMDVERDDPAHLRAYAERMGLTGDWTLLHGSDGDVRELAAVLGVRYRKEKDGSFSHSNIVTVLDREGRIAHQSVGLGVEVTDAVEAVRKLIP